MVRSPPRFAAMARHDHDMTALSLALPPNWPRVAAGGDFAGRQAANCFRDLASRFRAFLFLLRLLAPLSSFALATGQRGILGNGNNLCA